MKTTLKKLRRCFYWTEDEIAEDLTDDTPVTVSDDGSVTVNNPAMKNPCIAEACDDEQWIGWLRRNNLIS